MKLQSAIRAIYPAACVVCDAPTADENGLCAPCWGGTQFVSGLVCDQCGAPLPGEDSSGARIQCDDCMTSARPWDRGRTVLVYHGNGRRIVMGLKHADRTDLAIPAARWMGAKATAELGPCDVVVPVPLHWSRLLTRRYNQAALLSRLVALHLRVEHLPDVLVRPHRSRKMEHVTRAARFAALQGAIRPHPRRGAVLDGLRVLLVDDVMTSGATLTAATEAARAAGAETVDVLTLARVVKDA